MNPLIPAHAVKFFGPNRSEHWGGVPWDRGFHSPLRLEGLWRGAVSVFGTEATLIVTDDDIDTDGARGNKQIDPWWQPATNLKWPNGDSIDSWDFHGVVLPPTLTQFHVGLGDLCLVCLNGLIQPAQIHDTGPVRKCGETTLQLGRFLGAVPATQSDHDAATLGNDVTDMATLIFSGSGEEIRQAKGWRHVHALTPGEMQIEAMSRWARFTGLA